MEIFWNEIADDYDKAKAALWCDKHIGNWHRQEEVGYWHMWAAYCKAVAAETKDDLLFARILVMVAHENRFRVYDYDLYHKFVKPAVKSYERAKRNGQNPTESEVADIVSEAQELAYKLEQGDMPYGEQIKTIEGYELMGDNFCIYDSKPIWFEHDSNMVRLKLEYYDKVVTFLFDGVLELHVEGDPLTNYIQDFSCYRCHYNKSLVEFDIGYYKFLCSSVSVESVDKAKEE